jgi:serine/threonine protein kinase
VPPQGHAFGKYELLERLATGGMAEIFRARFRAAAGITKAVVIKKILPHYAGNQAFVRMFMDEAQIVVGLSHGNIAQVFDFGEIDGEYFLAMELVHGQALSKVVRRARERQIPVVPTPFAVFITLEMCKGLHYAHTRSDERGRAMGIVHRDVSPQNVILAYDGQVKLVDFGIAKARTAGRSETEVGALKGKYVYFAPEQARGKELDARTDVFAAGIVLYEMLCGRLPFEGKMMDVLAQIVRCEFPRPRSLNPEISPALERIVLTAMAAEKEDRYQSAQLFQEALAGYLYANAPTFSNGSLVHLLGYLYADELQAEGKPVPLPREFLEQVPLWQKPLPGTAAGASAQVTSAGHLGRKSRSQSRSRPSARDVNETRAALSSHGGAARTSNGYRSPAPVLQGRTKWLLGAVPLLAAAVAAGGVLALGHFGTFSLQLTSHPAGAQVRLNGQEAPGTTPLLISGLAANRLHLVEVSAPGMKRWTQTVQPERGATLPLHVTLEAEPVSVPPVPTQVRAEPVAAVTPEPPAAPAVIYEATWPVAQLRLSPRHHGFTVAPTRAARVRLDPARTYNIWTEGFLSLGGVLDVIQPRETFYFLEGTDALSPNELYGELAEGRKNAGVIRNATALYVFMFDDRGFDNSGAVRVRVQERGSKDITTLLLDAKLNTTWPDERQRFTLRGLDRNTLYEVSIAQGRTPAQVRAGRNGRLDRVVFLQNMGLLILMNRPTDEYARVMEVGQKYSVSGTEQMIFTFPDDALEDNDGELLIEVTPQIGSGGGLR